jgi:hypothetical protein
MSKGEFRPIPSIPGYLISKKGEVYSLKSNVFLEWNVNQDWYPRVQLYDKARGGRFHQFVHRLVAIVWVPNPDPIRKTQVNHNDWDKMNPFYKNLCWMTPEENKAHARKKWYAGIRIDESKYILDPLPCPF